MVSNIIEFSRANVSNYSNWSSCWFFWTSKIMIIDNITFPTHKSFTPSGYFYLYWSQLWSRVNCSLQLNCFLDQQFYFETIVYIIMPQGDEDKSDEFSMQNLLMLFSTKAWSYIQLRTSCTCKIYCIQYSWIHASL